RRHRRWGRSGTTGTRRGVPCGAHVRVPSMPSSPAEEAAALDPTAMRAAAREVLEVHWREPGFTCPNGTTYPWLWLWDSCFHSIVWAELGEPERALSELRTALLPASPDGFVPHLRYLDGSDVHQSF